MNPITYRTAAPDDAATIAAIHTASWRDAYAGILDADFLAGPIEADRLAHWASALAAPPPGQLLQVAVEGDGRAVGFICAHHLQDPRWGSWVDNLHIVPGMRGRKIGEGLLRRAADLLLQHGPDTGLFLWVFEANTAGLRFYERLGGRVVETTPSRIPAANGKPSLRVHWPSLTTLLQAPWR